MLALRETGLYQLLLARTSKNAIAYSGLLVHIESDADALLQFIKVHFSSYPDHSIQHSFRILNYLYFLIKDSCLLFDSSPSRLTDTEIFCLIMAALFHDTGMAFTDNGSIPSRADHHYFSTKILDLYIDDKFTILPFKDRLKPIISFVCFSHGLTIPELYSHSLFNKTDRIEFDEVRYSLLSVLLRIGDLLDIEECRSNAFILDHFKSMYSEESINHCIRNKRIQLYNYSIKGISIEVLADNVEQYKIWYTWFKYLEDEVLYFNTHLQNYSVCLPAPKTSIKKASGMNFEIEEYRFEIDESGGIWDILSQSIYTDEFDFIREIIQNAIDATLYLAFTKIQDETKRYSPRIWHSSCTIDDIWVGFSTQNKTLIIRDSGIGMDKNDLKRFLFKVSGSGYSNSDRKDLGFPGIAKFGIGFVSCLANADNIEIFTRKRSDSSTYHVSMSKNMSFAIVEKENIDNFLGTIISIKTKHSYEYKKVEAYIKDTFLFPSVGIEITNLDNVEKTLSEIGVKAELLNYYLIPYSFQQLIADNSIGINQRFNVLESQKHELVKIRDLIDQLENILHDIDRFTDKNGKLINTSNDAKTLRSVIERVRKNFQKLQIGFEFPIDYLNFDVEQTSDYLDSIYYIRPILQEKLNKIEDRMSIFSFRTQTHKCTPVSFGFKWKYCVVYLSDNLKVAKIKYSENPIKLDSGKGIVFMHHENINSDLGYEYDALIGFLFYNGLVHSVLNFFTSESVTSISRMRYSTRFIMPGLIEDIADLEEEVFTDTDDNPNASIDSHSFNQNYSSIFIKNNSIRYSDGFLLSELGLNYYNGKDYDLTVLVETYLTQHVDENDDIETVLSLDRYSFCQDGIKLPRDLQGLFPYGLFKITLNLTSNSRLALNVTRHKISENRTEISNWIRSTGCVIQKEILSDVLSSIKQLALSIEFDDLQRNELQDDYFTTESANMFKNSINELKQIHARR